MPAAQAIDHWKSSFGDEYAKRNSGLSIPDRVRLWSAILPRDCSSILEVGANVGANLSAIAKISNATLLATEPNDSARAQIDKSVRAAPFAADDLRYLNESVDLVFTSGVLIHVPPDKLEASLREIYRVAKRWIICGEYFAPQEEEISYRGQPGLMWRRDYGSLYLDMFPDLKCTMNMFAWKRTTGLDNLTFWVFEKQ